MPLTPTGSQQNLPNLDEAELAEENAPRVARRPFSESLSAEAARKRRRSMTAKPADSHGKVPVPLLSFHPRDSKPLWCAVFHRSGTVHNILQNATITEGGIESPHKARTPLKNRDRYRTVRLEVRHPNGDRNLISVLTQQMGQSKVPIEKREYFSSEGIIPAQKELSQSPIHTINFTIEKNSLRLRNSHRVITQDDLMEATAVDYAWNHFGIKIKTAEWGHAVAWMLGGAQSADNLFVQTKATNTDLRMLESALANYVKDSDAKIELTVISHLLPIYINSIAHYAKKIPISQTYNIKFENGYCCEFKINSLDEVDRSHQGLQSLLTEIISALGNDSLARPFQTLEQSFFGRPKGRVLDFDSLNEGETEEDEEIVAERRASWLGL